ncbi:TraR/DksA family transcriptional regulator [Hyphomonas sp.]|uniref:TraR/DksA family transcriptional regulator n=1 Tax=Hyphomonas sp. TaxID=87 RepID=UPI0025C0F6C2|nr:TraR/DksA family transcriptional regulator [Hyphomonas sp.]
MENDQLQEQRLRSRLKEYAFKIPARMPEYGAFKKSVVIWRIYRALRKIDEGTYGQCDACSQAIGAERLNLLPAAIMCVSCQTTAERK